MFNVSTRLLSHIAFLCLCTMNFTLAAHVKTYIDNKELDTNMGMHVHQGENVWIETKAIHTDELGLFILECDIVKAEENSTEMGYEKKWKCPYCFRMWPMGSPCRNPDCPSKY